ncbi:MAG: S1 RNA-binding domain-containing protein [Methanomassiliicoccales archaeon]|nr:MAG: S1 RNA-binding domain-containing protein [Methanomassiliicoccales archaeon]
MDNVEKTADSSNGNKLERELVIPGDHLSEEDLKSGMGTYSDSGRIYASRLGVKNIRAGYINVVPLGGRYIPRPGDYVIGSIIDIGPSNWLVDINAPYPAPLHVNEVPWRVEFGDTARFLKVGDTILVKIQNVDEIKRVHVTMNDHDLRRLSGGLITEISHSKVPRVIGKGGSMITLIKRYTKCRMFVGQNGRIWIDGDAKDIMIAVETIERIEAEAQVMGLTDAIKAFLEEHYSLDARVS